MAETTGIAWTDSTFNPWIGCTKVGPGCDNCYAEALMDKRWHRVQWGSGKTRQKTSAANWQAPLHWEKHHEAFALAHGRRRRVFCASLADVFDNEAPPQWRGDLWALVKATPNLDWLVLTKRVGNVQGMAQTRFCAASPSAGVCPGDSGAPAVLGVGGVPHVVGVVSMAVDNSSRCVESAAVITRVSAFREWITSVTR